VKRVSAEAVVASALAAACLLLLGPAWAKGWTAYWSDLTYLHLGWRAAPAQLIQAGRAPLWEPSLYFGMPMAASMQGGLFHPAGVLFDLYGFATALAAFQLLQLFTGGWLCALWLRSWGARWGSALGGGLLYALGGVMVARLSYLNHLAVLAWAPALPLFFRRPRELACALAVMVLAGYPTFVPGCALAAWGCALACARRPDWGAAARGWILAALAAAALAAAQLVPGFELAALSRRAAGVGLEEALTWSFSPRDLLQWIGPLATGRAAFDPAGRWVACVYLGAAGASAAAAGLLALERRRAAIVAAGLAAAFLLTLGSTTPVSRALWEALPPLRLVRYPGNLAYLALLPLSLSAAAGLRGRLGAVLLLAAIAELPVLGRMATPLAPREIFSDPGPLARVLQERLEGTRYLVSPRALHASMGENARDWRSRLYGLTNAPARLRAAANFGEPLVPAASYAVLDALHRLPGAAEAAAWMPWVGASRLLTPTPASAAALEGEGRVLWEVSRVKRPVALAYAFGPREGAALPAALPDSPPALGRPLRERREREDRFSVSGAGAGWLFVSEPLYPGWRVEVVSAAGRVPAAPEPALGAFQKVPVPEGPWTVRWRYEPASWAAGLFVTTAALLALAASWYHRLAAIHP
jgi:hypothetical protein